MIGTIPMLVQAATIAIGAAALYVTLRGIRQQLWLTTFCDFTKRYSDFMAEIPMRCRYESQKFGLDSVGAEERDRLLCLALRYLNLCSEEYYLHLTKKIVDRRTWEMWEADIIMSVRRRWLLDAWAIVRSEFDSFPAFRDFIEQVQAGVRPARSIDDAQAA